jgi:hypothetical protein
MNRIPHPVNLVSKLIIIILTNFTGKSGAENQGAAKDKMEIRKMKLFRRGPPQVTGGLKSRRGEKDNYFDNQCYL